MSLPEGSQVQSFIKVFNILKTGHSVGNFFKQKVRLARNEKNKMKATKLTTHNSTLNINSRAVLMAQYGFIEFDDEALCDNTITRSNARKAKPINVQNNDIEIIENTNNIIIQSKSNKELQSINVYDMNGKIAKSYTTNSSIKIHTIETKNMTKGLYLVNIIFEDGTTKIIKLEII